MKNILYILLFLPVFVLGQTTTQNYIKTLIYKQETTTSNPAYANASVTYFDGLGRPIQQIANKQSGTDKDLITHIEYDGFGRQSRQYLPYSATTDNMDFVSSAQSNTVTFYNTSTFESTSNPWNESFFEASPLNRVVKQSAPGTAWIGNADNDNDHTIKYAYLTNTSADAVKKLSATVGVLTNGAYPPTFVDGGYYEVGALYKTITQDENKASAIHTGSTVNSKLNTTEEYKNKQGQIVLKRTFNQSPGEDAVPLDTYYVYDKFGNLTYVLPPAAAGSIAGSNLDNYCYQYKYDYRNRLVEKKLPGKLWEFIVYDTQDRVVATGPALNPWGGTTTGWLINKYDAFGRIAYTGWYSASGFSSSMRTSFQTNNAFTTVTKTTTATLIDNVNVYYTNSFPTAMKVLTINYYDNYVFSGAPTSTILTTPVLEQPLATNYKGLSTGSWVRALTSSTQTSGEISYTLYDAKSRPVFVRTTNYLGGYTEVSSKLDFDGTLLETVTNHKRSSSTSDQVITTTEDFTYTAQDRLLSQTHQIGSQAAQLMAYNTYNAIGQLTSKKVGNTSASPLQQVDYKYNIRGWLTSINNILELNNGVSSQFPSSQPQDLFAYKINYNGIIEQTLGGSVTALYNGNIAEVSWRTATDNIQRSYGFTYDKLNRLTDAWYQIPQASVPVRNSYDEHLAYDENGNITALQRNGELDSATTVTEIDDLAYTYDGNQLTEIKDYTNNPKGAKDTNTSGADYTYDAFGNLKTDKNKGITTAITYNHLNLPVTIVINDGINIGTISYLYNAAGVKLKKTVTPSGGTAVVTDYLGGYQYVGGVLEFFPTSEGYVKHTVIDNVSNYNYVFQYKDHLGNNRVSYTVDPSDGVLKILEEDHYYPFGLKHEGYSATQSMIRGSSGTGVHIVSVITPADVAYKYMYNGKELQDELGLNQYDFGARNYDPAIGRWMNIDPLAENHHYNSPYVYANNNPVIFIDPDGMDFTLTGAAAQDFVRGMQMGLAAQDARGGGDGGGDDPDAEKPGLIRRAWNWIWGIDDDKSEVVVEDLILTSMGDEADNRTSSGQLYGGDGSGSFSDWTSRIVYETDQYNPIALAWDGIKGWIDGTDRYGNELNGAESTVKILSSIPIGKYSSVAGKSLGNFGENLFLSETFGITSTKFGSSAAYAQGSFNKAGRFFKAGWSTGTNSAGEWGFKFRIGIGSKSTNSNIARFHIYVPKSFVPNNFANPSIQVKRSLYNLELRR
jgi:RHS repeat-associated protein